MSQPASVYSTSFDQFIYGMALFNHATDLGYCCKETTASQRVITYLAGMGEHVIYLLAKVATLVLFFFLNILLSLHYLTECLRDNDFREITYAQIRLYVGLLTMAETLPGMLIDLVGCFCPPVAHKVHTFIKEHVTRRYFEKWGIIKHDFSKENFNYANFFKNNEGL